MPWRSKELSPLHQLPQERLSVSWLSRPTVSGMELGQHCLLEVYVWESFINKGIIPQFKYEVFTPKAWVRKFWLLIQLYEQGVWESDWIRWWIVFWWSPSMIALFGSGLGGQWDTSWMEISHPHPFFFFSASIRWAVSSATHSSHLGPTTMEHTDWIQIPTQWASWFFLLYAVFISVHSEWWNIWLTQLENANNKETRVYSGDYVLPFSPAMAVGFAGHSSKPVFPPSTLTYGSFLSTKGPVHRGLGGWTYQCWICTECALVSNILTQNNPEWQHSWRKFL